MQTIEAIKEAITPIAQEYGLKRVYLFGSYAKGTATEDSDVDLLIEKGETRLSLLGLSGIMLDAKEALKLPVDVIVRRNPDTEFQKNIKGSEILLYENMDFRQKYSQVPWREWCGVRDIFAHQYEELKVDVAWETIEYDVPALRENVERILKEMSLLY